MEKFVKEHKILTLLFVIIIIVFPIVLVHVLFKTMTSCKWLVAEWEAGDLLNYFGSILGAIATIIAIIIAIKAEKNSQKDERKFSMKPSLSSFYVPISWSDYSFDKKPQIIYTNYTLTSEKDEVYSSIQEPKVLIDLKNRNARGESFGNLELMRNYYIFQYTINNVGAGNAVNIVLTINDKPIMRPFSLGVNNSKEFIIILNSDIKKESNHLLNFKYIYDDVASMGRYEQKESIEVYVLDGLVLDARQDIKQILTLPQEV